MPDKQIAVINPEWVNAPFEVRFVMQKGVYAGYQIEPNDTLRFIPSNDGTMMVIDDPWPLRFRDASLKHPVPPFIYAS